MNKSNNKKSKQLGMPFGTANGRLRKKILFHLLQKSKENICFQCKNLIETEEELSIEHKKPWLDKNTELFWDINNIAFSHLSCNAGAAKQTKPRKHPSSRAYMRGCRCKECRDIERKRRKNQRERGIKT